MHPKFISRLLVAILLFITQSYLLPFNKIREALAQAPTFSLITPYYGTKTIRSYFDHNYPTYTNDNKFVRYDGQQWIGNVDINNCQNYVNCYDGHNGLDIVMDYEDVLATADGMVWKSGWDITNCHNGNLCNYGLVVKTRL
jgi:murein DD-endopeptidase MepM/ murein hydrolase activator NlpD